MRKNGIMASIGVLGVMCTMPFSALAADVVGVDSTTKFKVNGEPTSISGYEIDGYNYFKLRDILSTVGIRVEYDEATNIANIITNKDIGSKKLMEGNWAKETREAIQAVIDKNANSGKYVVFDFDNTSVINDVQEALLIYQIEHLQFNIKPEQMRNVLKTQIPDLGKAVGKSLDGKEVTCEQLIEDIANSYKWLYNNYEGLNGGQTLEDIHKSNEYKEFSTKLRYMYSAIGDTFDAKISYPWVTYLFTGMKSDEVRKLASDSHRYWQSYTEFKEVEWESPKGIESKAGQVSVKYLTGLNFTDELKDLYHVLRNNGIDVYVCSASFIDVIKAAVCDPEMGYGVSEDNVYAMRLKEDADGRYLAEYDYDFGGKGKYAQTQGEGKSAVIAGFIAPKYNGDGPLMVFGDSAGDYNMMTDFKETELGVIFNRYRKTSDPIYKLSKVAAANIGKENPKYVLQGRDNNTGKLIPTQYSKMLGEEELVLVRE